MKTAKPLPERTIMATLANSPLDPQERETRTRRFCVSPFGVRHSMDSIRDKVADGIKGWDVESFDFVRSSHGARHRLRAGRRLQAGKWQTFYFTRLLTGAKRSAA